jgi:hypothetical protein
MNTPRFEPKYAFWLVVRTGRERLGLSRRQTHGITVQPDQSCCVFLFRGSAAAVFPNFFPLP